MEFFGVKGIRICGEAIGGANYFAPYAFEPQWRSGEAIREDAAFAAHVVNVLQYITKKEAVVTQPLTQT